MNPHVPASLQRPADAGLYARSFTDVYDDWYDQLHDVEAVADTVGRFARPDGRVLELGSGTGRLAGALAERHAVVALDVSHEMLMLDRSATQRIEGDMAQLPLAPRTVSVCLIAYNTLFNLATLDAQRQCLTEVARVLETGGVLIVETFVAPPPNPEEPFAMSVVAHHTDTDRRLAIATWQHAERPERITGAHVELGPQGCRSRPWQLVYRSPIDLDALANAVGLRLEGRASDWHGGDFHSAESDRASVRQIGVYRRLSTEPGA